MHVLRRFLAALMIVLGLGPTSQVAAQEGAEPGPTPPSDAAGPPPGAPGVQRDPPARVGRLSFVQGTVSFKPGGVDAWAVAVLNRPVTRGDSVWTDEGARAEVHVGTLAIRLGAKTSLYISNLDDTTVQLSVAQGSAIVHLREVDAHQLVEVDLPNAAATLRRTGTYRVDVDEGGERSVVRVVHGEAEVMASGAGFAVTDQQAAELTGATQPTHSLIDMGPADDLDTWGRERDAREENPSALRYVSRGTVGYEDLDDNGSWDTSPEYGSVWVPRAVPVGWAPYHYGHWAWIDPWGWTWVDDAPWGFAPFHYGRWAYWGSRWAWVPGPVVRRPCYAPALVAFTAGVAVGAAIAWWPLGPREVWVPGYHTSYAYVRQANYYGGGATNVTVIHNNTYINRSVPGAVTAVPQTAFQSAQPVHANALSVNQAALAHATVTPAAGVLPQRASVVGAGALTAARPPAAAMSRQMVTRVSPPAAPRPFATRQAMPQANAPRPAAANYSRPAAAQPAPRYVPQAAPHYSAPLQHYSAPVQRYSPPPQHYSPLPQQHYAPPHESHYAPSHMSFGHGGGGGGGGHRGPRP